MIFALTMGTLGLLAVPLSIFDGDWPFVRSSSEANAAIMGALVGAVIGFLGSFLNELYRDRRMLAEKKQTAAEALVAFVSELSIVLREIRQLNSNEGDALVRYQELRNKLPDMSKAIFLESFVAIDSEFVNLCKIGKEKEVSDKAFQDSIADFVNKFQTRLIR